MADSPLVFSVVHLFSQAGPEGLRYQCELLSPNQCQSYDNETMLNAKAARNRLFNSWPCPQSIGVLASPSTGLNRVGQNGTMHTFDQMAATTLLKTASRFTERCFFSCYFEKGCCDLSHLGVDA